QIGYSSRKARLIREVHGGHYPIGADGTARGSCQGGAGSCLGRQQFYHWYQPQRRRWNVAPLIGRAATLAQLSKAPNGGALSFSAPVPSSLCPHRKPQCHGRSSTGPAHYIHAPARLLHKTPDHHQPETAAMPLRLGCKE